jgi:hypothetical protein
MITEAIEITADVLAEPTNGIDAQVARMIAGGYLDASDDPGPVTIGCSTRDAAAALGRNMDATLSCTVFFADAMPTEATGEVNLLDGTLLIGVRFDSTDDVPYLNERHLGVLMRAASRSIRWWWRAIDPASWPFQTRHGVELLGGLHIRPAKFAPTADSPNNTAGLAVAAQFRDALPD